MTNTNYKNAVTEISTQDRLNACKLAGDRLEEIYIPPFTHSCINYRTIKDLPDFNGLWAQKLIVDGVQAHSPFDYDQSDFDRLQQHYDYFSKQVMAAPNQTFFTNYKEKYLLLRVSLCSFTVGLSHETAYKNSYGWYVTDSPVSIKLRMTLVDPHHNLAIATFMHENTGPQSLRKMDKERGMDEVAHLIVNSLKQLCQFLPELAGYEEKRSRLESVKYA